MRKLFTFFVMALAVMTFVSYSYAGSADAKISSAGGNGIVYVNGMGDLSSGNTAEIDSDGSVSVKEYPLPSVSGFGDQAALVSGACVVKNIIVNGVSAGDSAYIYDALTVTGTPIFDITVGTALDTKVVPIPGGRSFSTGVSIDATDSDVKTTIVYDN